jgi:hypothetical protein
MSTLAITVLEAAPASQTGAPAINFRLRIEDILQSGPVHAMLLRCQLRIEPRRRPYTPQEQARLYELFGAPAQWDRTLQSVTWTHASTLVPSYERRTDIDLFVPVTYDLEVASAKYFHAIREGDIPLSFFFSGSIFRTPFSVEPLSWDLESTFRLPSEVWRATMERFFPGGGWVRLQRETIDRLQAFRGRQAVVTWDEAIDQLLHAAQQSI